MYMCVRVIDQQLKCYRSVMYMCVRVIDQESEQLCICVVGLSIRSGK